MRRVALSRYIVASICILSIAIAVGAATLAFRIVDGVFWRYPTGVRGSTGLMRLVAARNGGRDVMNLGMVSTDQYRTMNEMLPGGCSLAGYSLPALVADGTTEAHFRGQQVTYTYFSVLGTRAALGRLIAPDDRRSVGMPIVVISEAFWRSVFGGNAAIVGQTLPVRGKRATIIGVAERGFHGIGASTTGFWMASAAPGVDEAQAEDEQDVPWLYAFARCRSGSVSKNLAGRLEIGLNGAPRSAATYGMRFTLSARPLRGALSAIQDPSGAAVARAEALVRVVSVIAFALVFVCVCNLLCLLVGRSAQRRREYAVRIALGASLRSMFWLTLREYWVYGALGMAFGLMISMYASRVAGFVPAVDVSTTLNAAAILCAGACAALLTVGIAFIIARRVSRIPPAAVLKETGTTRTRYGLLAWLAALEVAAAFAATSGCVELTTNALLLQRAGLGVDTTGLVVLRSAGMNQLIVDETLDRLRQLPGAAATASYVTYGGKVTRTVRDASGRELETQYNGVDSSYFAVLRLRPVRGRLFDAADVRNGTGVIINSALANQYWPARNPLTECLRTEKDGQCEPVLAIVPNVKTFGLTEPPKPTVYVPLQVDDSFPLRAITLRLPARSMASANTIVAASGFTGVFTPYTLLADREIARLKAQAATLGALAVLALIVAASGVYGIFTYVGVQQEREMAIRLALGANHLQLAALASRYAIQVVLVGVAIGLPCALMAIGLSRSLLAAQEIDPRRSLGVVTFVIVAVVAIASLPPIIRLRLLQPLEILREE